MKNTPKQNFEGKNLCLWLSLFYFLCLLFHYTLCSFSILLKMCSSGICWISYSHTSMNPYDYNSFPSNLFFMVNKYLLSIPLPDVKIDIEYQMVTGPASCVCMTCAVLFPEVSFAWFNTLPSPSRNSCNFE